MRNVKVKEKKSQNVKDRTLEKTHVIDLKNTLKIGNLVIQENIKELIQENGPDLETGEIIVV